MSTNIRAGVSVVNRLSRVGKVISTNHSSGIAVMKDNKGYWTDKLSDLQVLRKEIK